LYRDYLNNHPDVRHVPGVIWSGEAAERLCSECERRVLKEIGAPSLEISSAEITNQYWEVDYNERDW
jgi:hypothetical protein